MKMQTLKTKSDTKTKKEKLPKDETPKKQEDKLKSVYNLTTPRNNVRKSSSVGAANIYSQNKKTVMAPKKTSSTTNARAHESPMKNLLKSSPSSVSQVSSKANIGSSKKELKTPRTAKDLPFSNVTVNSPIEKKKLNLKREPSSRNLKSDVQGVSKRPNEKNKSLSNASNSKSLIIERERTKTRTLEDDEVKVLNSDAVDNNAAMMNLSQKLKAQPKAFYIDLDENKSLKNQVKSSDEDSYEDDFESYESDFESYHSGESKSEKETEEEQEDKEERSSVGSLKEAKDEEKMLDSGNFELRDSQRSANRPKLMDHITEDSEDVRQKNLEDFKKTSLTDEGFQDLSSSSATCSMKTFNDVLDRPLFIDFNKSKENKRKRRVSAHYRQRAKDLLSMITLHEMSYSLFEMKPISYDLYMATFGKSNYTQTAVQTFEDGVSEEVQTDEIDRETKWTQHPVEFSKNDIIYTIKDTDSKYGKKEEDYLSKFMFLINKNADDLKVNTINENENYKSNPLRVYLEQKDGVGSGEVLPYVDYKSKIENNEFNVDRLGRFLKKVERRVSRVLNKESSSDCTNLMKSKLPFSKGYVTITTENIADYKFDFLKSNKISAVIFSDTKENLIMTVHKKSLKSVVGEKCIICLWDLNVARTEPLKILVAIDNVTISRFKGDSNGLFVTALEDSSIHLWDLSEKPNYQNSVASDDKTTNLVENNSERLTQIEKDREWNLNSHVVHDQPVLNTLLQSSSFTSSGANVLEKDTTDNIVGLEFTGHTHDSQNGGRKLIGQLCSLQSIGKLTIWSIIQEKINISHNIGKAYWSKTFLEKTQTISLIDFLDTTTIDNENFNLSAAKIRLASKKEGKMKISRPKTTVKKLHERPASAANLKIKKIIWNNWESGLICSDLKVVDWRNVNNYLVARNCGEVLCCVRSAGAVKVTRMCVATDTSSVTCLEVLRQGLPYFLAATDTGTVSLYSMPEARVLLTLDCRNRPPSIDRCQSDSKGRFVGTAPSKPSDDVSKHDSELAIKCLVWSQANPCHITALAGSGAAHSWDLARSDIHCVCASERAAVECSGGHTSLALITQDGEVQVHRLNNEERSKDYKQLFQKYVALL